MVTVLSFILQHKFILFSFLCVDVIKTYNRENDHEAFLGVFKEDYDDLSQEEAKRRLR